MRTEVCAKPQAQGVSQAVPLRNGPVTGARHPGRRRGKQPDGSAKTREVKLATVWTAEGRDPDGWPLPRPRVGQLQRRRRERGQPRHGPAAGRLPPTRPSRGATARLRHRRPTGRHRRRRPLDLELGRRAVSRRHPNHRPLPRQAASERCGQGHPRGPRGTSPIRGTGPEGRVGRRTPPRPGRGAGPPRRMPSQTVKGRPEATQPKTSR